MLIWHKTSRHLAICRPTGRLFLATRSAMWRSSSMGGSVEAALRCVALRLLGCDTFLLTNIRLGRVSDLSGVWDTAVERAAMSLGRPVSRGK
jgi:hypothetical protein